MRYASDLKNPTLAELDEIEADWRETAERQINDLAGEVHFPTPEELDELSAEDALDAVECAVEEYAQFANDFESDARDWYKAAIARIRTRAKTAKKATKAKAA
jgi:hypothetical protein